MDGGDDRAVCRGCGYALFGLPDAVCPECGRPFDPGDPRSYVVPVPFSFWRSRWTVLPVCLVLYWAVSYLLWWAFGPYQWDVALRLQGPLAFWQLFPAVSLPVAACCAGLILAHPLKPAPTTAVLTLTGLLAWYCSGYLAWEVAMGA